MLDKRVILSGGGTGGHIFPAIAVANALKAKDAGIEILFVGASDRMEMDRVPKAGYKIVGLWISGIQRKLSVKNLMFPFKLISSLAKSFRIIRSFKPKAIAGFGGFASGPVMQVAQWLGIPVVIQEQNSYPGITNKLLAKGAKHICVSYPEMGRFFPEDQITITGNPIRKDLLALDISATEAKKKLGIDAKFKQVVLIMGGSLGARTINKSVVAAHDLIAAHPDTYFIWQVGKLYVDEYLDCPTAKLTNVNAVQFIDQMDLAYRAADVVCSRAGAITISEICALGKTAVLVPSPNVAEDHQTKNAEVLSKRNAAALVSDANAETEMIPACLALVSNEPLRKSMAAKAAELGKHDAANEIADLIISLL